MNLWSDMPPIFVALTAIFVSLTWHIAGTISLGHFLKFCRLPARQSYLIAWVCWVPVSGSMVLGAFYFNLIDKGFLWITQLAIVAYALSRLPKLKDDFQGSFSHLLASENRKYVLFCCGWVGLALLFAAHPQRLYDQLNYHLVVSKQLFLAGDPFKHAYDPHILMTGPLEFSIGWLRNLIADDLFVIAAGQATVFIASVGGVIFALLHALELRGKFSMQWCLLLVLLIPAMIPNNEMVQIVKPGGLLLSACVLLLVLFDDDEIQWLPVALFVGLLFIATKLTFIHAVLAGSILLGRKGLWENLLKYRLYLYGLSLGCFALVIFKNYFEMGHLLYPADGFLIESAFSDQETVNYWQGIAYSGETSLWQKYQGPFKLLWRNPALLIWTILLLVLPWSQFKTHFRNIKTPLLFMGAYWLTWPLFYGSEAFSRFVAPFVGSVIYLGWLGLIHSPPRWKKAATVVSAILAFSVSHIDVHLMKIYRWNQTSTLDAFASQFPRIKTAKQLNDMHLKGSMIMVDDAGKYFFDQGAFHGTIAPYERRMWEEFKNSSQASAAKYELSAMVQTNPDYTGEAARDHLLGPFGQVWQKLSPHGDQIPMGRDLVLYSRCNFRAKPCPKNLNKRL
jgi:hypothetical protein